jgi:hypothetical protein
MRGYVQHMVSRNFAFVFAAAMALMLPSARGDIITQTSVVSGVTVAATAGNLGPQTTVWDFAVVLDSADQDLGDDLVKSAVLLDANGHEQQALIWEGAPAAGMHRAGVLKFIAVSPRPEWIELRITRPGEAKPRSFSWLLASGLVALR